MPKGIEVPSLETARSRTWKKSSGSYVTRSYGQAVNVKDADGNWTPIDNTLSRSSSGSIVNGDGVAELALPTSLDAGAVKLTHGGDTLSLRLQGAGDGAATLKADTATYPDVAPGVSAKLSATNAGLKEDLLLASAQSQNSFTYDVSLSAGLKLVSRKDGGIDAVNGAGKTAFSLAAPLTIDAKGDVASGTESTMTTNGNSITVSLDEAWLAEPGRAFPVVLDPSATVTSARDCYLDGQNTTTTYCTAADLWVGSSGGHDHKAILNFDLSSAIPEAANIQYADLNLYPNSQTSPGVAKNLSAHEITSPFDNTATWVKRTAAANWTTPGGDIAAADLDSVPVPATNTWAYWNITDLVSGWIDGTKANNGVAVTDDGSAANNSVVFQSFDGPASNDPFIDIDWYPRLGTPADATMISQPISSTASVGVNVAGGNLQLASNDLKVASTGLPVSVGRVYNSQDNLWDGMLGSKGRLTLGNDIVEYKIDDRDDRMIIMPGGARFRFAFDPATSKYKTPAGAGNVTLTRAAPT
ncbi:MAG: DNRLRE domain-containing protein, partial [Beijerinckiaceae bacterium]|nr:DNRLRE domain-containing protein [Beijerinckiaceae bacterium]